MKHKNLGKLLKTELREAWASEASEFTPWLAQAENLQVLADAIGIDLICHTKEARVGPFRADILCKDTANDSWVLIENQLEQTDHLHLGQLLTYAGGLDAVTIVWVAEIFTEEHRAALDWLNEHTDEKIKFFGLEIELWRIGDSPPAPKFSVVCKPNEWTRFISESAKRNDPDSLSGRAQFQYQYWDEFLKVLRKETKVQESRSPQASAGMGFPAGRAGFRLWTEIWIDDHQIGVGLEFQPPHAAHYFKILRGESKQLEKDLGCTLEWDEQSGRRNQHVAVYRKCDPNDREDWPMQHNWLAQNLERFQRVLGDKLKRLPAAPRVGDAN